MTGPRLVALDLSLAATGIAWTHNAFGLPVTGCSTVKTRRNFTGPGIDHARVLQIMIALDAAVRGGRPQLVIVEWLPQYDGRGDASLRLAELHGVVKQWLWQRRTPYIDVYPQHLQMFATGKGRALKDEVREAVTASYGHLTHVGDDNQADALALLAMGCAAYGAPLAPHSSARGRALAAVKWPSLDPPAGVESADPPPAGAQQKPAKERNTQ